MKKFFSVLVAIAMCACLCLPAFAAEDALDADNLSSALDGLDLSGFDADSIKSAASNLEADLAETDILGSITDVVGSLFSSVGGSSTDGTDESASAGSPLDSITDMLSSFDATGALTTFVESLSGDGLSELFSGLLGSLSGEGVDLSGFDFGSFDISSILGGNSGDGAGVASIMDTFGGVLEMLGLDSATIESLLDNDIVNFFANLYIGAIGKVEEPTEVPTEPETTKPSTTPDNPKMGDTSTVAIAMATLAIASAAAFVCTKKKKHA